MNTHHVETFIADGFLNRLRTYGWQCFTCHQEADGFKTFRAADAAAEQHRQDTETEVTP